MFAVAVRAIGSVLGARFDGFAVDAFVELTRNLLVALRAGGRNLPMTHRGLRVTRRQNSVATVTIGANRSVFAL